MSRRDSTRNGRRSSLNVESQQLFLSSFIGDKSMKIMALERMAMKGNDWSIQAELNIDHQKDDNLQLYMGNDDSEWKTKSKAVINRKKGWLQRYGTTLTEDNIAEKKEKVSYFKHLISENKRRIDYTKEVTVPTQRTPYSINSVQAFIDSSKKNNYCYLCFGLCVSGNKISCKTCPILSHISCVVDIKAPNNDTGNDWVCPFCQSEIVAFNNYDANKYASRNSDYIRTISSYRIITFFRMAVVRYSYIKAKNGLRILQRKIRSLLFWRQRLREKAKELAPFRIRLHEIELVCLNSNRHETKEDTLNYPVFQSKVVGELPSSIFDLYCMNDGNNSSTDGDKATSDDTTENTGNSPRDTLCTYLMNGHSSNPSYLKSYDEFNQPKSTVALTISVDQVFHHDGSNNTAGDKRQIVRFDTMLKENKHYRRHITKEWLNVHGFKGNDHDRDYIIQNYQIRRFVCPDSYVLIHAASSEATVKFTFTQISDCWPKAFIIGQVSKVLTPYLLWKKTGVQESNINQYVDSDEYPVPDELSKLMFAPKILAKKTADRHYLKTTSAFEASKIVGSDVSHHAEQDDVIPSVVGGVFNWTILSTSQEVYNAYSFMYLLVEGSQRKRVYCMLLDGYFSMYGARNIEKIDKQPTLYCKLESATISVADSAQFVTTTPNSKTTGTNTASFSGAFKFKNRGEVFILFPLSESSFRDWLKKFNVKV